MAQENILGCSVLLLLLLLYIYTCTSSQCMHSNVPLFTHFYMSLHILFVCQSHSCSTRTFTWVLLTGGRYGTRRGIRGASGTHSGAIVRYTFQIIHFFIFYVHQIFPPFFQHTCLPIHLFRQQFRFSFFSFSAIVIKTKEENNEIGNGGTYIVAAHEVIVRLQTNYDKYDNLIGEPMLRCG